MSDSAPNPALIDSQLLALFDCVAEYQQLRSGSSNLLRQAFFDLALAKRSAGYQWISPDLYSGRARAIATVSINEEHPISMRVVRNSSRTNNDDEKDQDGDAENADSGLRRRRRHSDHKAEYAEANSSGDEDEESLPNDSEKSDKEKRSAAVTDPLLWFGMLVPPTLKSAQSGFVSSLDQFIQLAQLKHRLVQQQQALHKVMAASTVKHSQSGAENLGSVQGAQQ
ncbi:hypothetical protein GGI24_003337 [Coemansia furcata]|nr:hypothetical protein GGI24_003337 [Coemansia furcata]